MRVLIEILLIPVAPILMVLGAIVGWRAGLTIKGYGFGLIGNIVVGISGAAISGWLLPQFMYFQVIFDMGWMFFSLVFIFTIVAWLTGLIVRRGRRDRTIGDRLIDGALMVLTSIVVTPLAITLMGLLPSELLSIEQQVFYFKIVGRLLAAVTGGGILLLLVGLPRLLRRVAQECSRSAAQ